jgi:hypothetical protein
MSIHTHPPGTYYHQIGYTDPVYLCLGLIYPGHETDRPETDARTFIAYQNLSTRELFFTNIVRWESLFVRAREQGIRDTY